MGCCGSTGGSSNAALGKRPGTAVSAMNGVGGGAARKPASSPTKKQPAAKPKATGIGAVQEANRTKAREKAIQALMESLQQQETLVPSTKWRRQYVKVNGIGPAVASALADWISPGRTVVSPPPTRKARQPIAVSPGAGGHTIETLDLRALKIGDEGVAALARALATDPLVRNVLLPSNDITDDGARSMAAAFGGNPASTIRLLVLSDNPVSNDGLTALASVLANLRCLERVELGHGQVSEENACEDAQLTDKTISQLIAFINASDSLETFVFKGTGIPTRTDFTPTGMSRFLTEVVGRSRLHSLFLQECFTTKVLMPSTNTIYPTRKKGSPGGSASTGTGSGNNTAPTSPAIDPNAYLQPMMALASALTQPSTHLTTLVLRFPLSDAAMSQLCNGFAKAVLLLNLSLRGCDLSAAGLRMLADALRGNRTIAALDISYQSTLIAHPVVLAEMRNSSKRRFSYANASELRGSLAGAGESANSSAIDSFPSRQEREHPLLPIIQVMHTNRTISQLIMLGVNVSTDDIEELCSCIEQSNNHVLTDVAYTSTGADALNMKLESFLATNREYGAVGGTGSPAASVAASARGMVRVGSGSTVFGDSITERSGASETPYASLEKSRSPGTAVNIPQGHGPHPTLVAHHPPSLDDVASRGLPPKHANASSSNGSMAKDTPQRQRNAGDSMVDLTPEDIDLRVGTPGSTLVGANAPPFSQTSRQTAGSGEVLDENDEGGTAPYFSRSGRFTH